MIPWKATMGLVSGTSHAGPPLTPLRRGQKPGLSGSCPVPGATAPRASPQSCTWAARAAAKDAGAIHGWESSRLPAPKLDWDQYQQALRQGCHSALLGRSLPVGLAAGACALCRLQERWPRPPRSSPGEPVLGGSPTDRVAREQGPRYERETFLLTCLRLGWSLLWEVQLSGESSTIPKQIRQKVAPLPAGP